MSIMSTLSGWVVLGGGSSVNRLLTSQFYLGSGNSDGLNLRYQWWVDGKILPGAQGATLWLDSGLIGRAVSAQVSYFDQAGALQAFKSEPLSVAAAVDLASPSYSWRGQTYFWKQVPARSGELAAAKGNVLLDQVDLSDPASIEKNAQTGMDGAFYLSNVNASSTLSIQKATTNTDSGALALNSYVRSAISLADVLDALKIYLRKPVPSPSPYKTMAADINQDGQVALSDVLSLLKIYLGKSTSEQPRWIFVDEKADLSGITPSHTQVPAPQVSDNPAKLVQNFAAVLVGDVNGSWLPPATKAYQVLPPDHFTAEQLGLVGVTDASLQLQFGLS